MCGRFALYHDRSALVEHLAVEQVAVEFKPRYNIAPTQAVNAVLRHPEQPQPVLDALQWGLVPFWAKDAKIGSRMINARAETVAEKPAYRAAFKRRRCLVAASGYYEWKKQENGKTPFYFSMRDGRPFAMAGLWEEWHSPDGELLHTCTLITTQANEYVASFHHRMPVILNLPQQLSWLNADPEARSTLEALLVPYTADDLSAHAVSTQVNVATWDDPNCIARVME
jgi:putative SOS response-associated peptidase YedK